MRSHFFVPEQKNRGFASEPAIFFAQKTEDGEKITTENTEKKMRAQRIVSIFHLRTTGICSNSEKGGLS